MNASSNQCFLALTILLLTACVEYHPHREEGNHALVSSWREILTVDGAAPSDPYQVILSPGDHQIDVLYRTYRQNYLCRFEFEAVRGYSYEIVDHSNPEPLVLYRWVRANGAWAERLDPVIPQCGEQSTSNRAVDAAGEPLTKD